MRPIHVAPVALDDLPADARSEAFSLAVQRSFEPWAVEAPWVRVAMLSLATLAVEGATSDQTPIMVPTDDSVTLLFDMIDILSRDQSVEADIREVWRRLGAAIDLDELSTG
jgi:hypothetical protein